MSFRHAARGGCHFRVADPEWTDPLDGSYSKVAGGRWNPPGAFPVVYLMSGLRGARALVASRLAGQPFGPEDLDPEKAPVLIDTDVAEAEFVDLVSDRGLIAAGLPATYPKRKGRPVEWAECQPIGQRAYDAGEPGLAVRSALPGLDASDEELAWFQRRSRLALRRRRAFAEWFWPS